MTSDFAANKAHGGRSGVDPAVALDARGLGRALARMAHEIAERNPDPAQVVLVGVQRGGALLARRLATLLTPIFGREIPCGFLDVAMHRDDLDTRGAPVIHPTEIPGDINRKTVVLVDDVLFSGRTTRAALDALHDYGRPSRVQLAVLVDRGHRELPITADFVGKKIPTSVGQRVEVKWAEESGRDEVRLEGVSA